MKDLWRRIARHKWAILAACGVSALSLAAGASPYLVVAGAALLAIALAADEEAGRTGPSSLSAARAHQARFEDQLVAAVQDLLDALPDPALLLGPGGRVIAQNAAFGDAIGEVPAGRSLTTVLRAPEVGDAINAARASGEAVRFEYFERVPVDRWFAAHVVPVGEAVVPRARSGESGGGLLLIMRDMTHQQQVERMRADFVANASHELRTPLASLAGFIETLQGPAKRDTEARERFLELMRSQAWRMSRLIDDLLSLSRIELKAHVRPQDRVDLVEAIGFVADTMQPLAREAGLALSFQTALEAAWILGDRDEIVQLFQNLVENALKYGQSGEKVDVTLDSTDGEGGARRFRVAVRDYGPGIAREDLPRLTERFYRVDVASSRAKGGTGLGLAIVKHILNRHRGTLDIRSTLGEGATFEVLLDAADERAAGVTKTGYAQAESR